MITGDGDKDGVTIRVSGARRSSWQRSSNHGSRTERRIGTGRREAGSGDGREERSKTVPMPRAAGRETAR